MIQYAANIGDMTRDTIISWILLAPYIDKGTLVNVEPKSVDGRAVALTCDPETFNNIIAVVRLKYSKNLFRFYKATKNGKWIKV